MPFAFWSELVNPADILPARYFRLPDAPAPELAQSSKKAALGNAIHAAARKAREIHRNVCEMFSNKLRRILQPRPGLERRHPPHDAGIRSEFLRVLRDLGWRPDRL